jgi:hypothetical protein
MEKAGDQFGRVADLPPIRTLKSPSVVRVFDRIRRILDDDDTYAEFCWFAREYPRCYRFHLDGADFRLSSVHRLMTRVHSQLVLMAQGSPSSFEVSFSNRDVHQVYWDFESFLSEISVSLDLLARIAGPAFDGETPLSFNRFCKRTAGTHLTELFQAAERRWVKRMKDYRDCFFHYTPVDTLLMMLAATTHDAPLLCCVFGYIRDAV